MAKDEARLISRRGEKGRAADKGSIVCSHGF